MYRPIQLDDAIELFDPQTGHRIRVDGPTTQGLRQIAPRSVQFALTNHCNLGCWFCSRPIERPSTWTVASALEVLADLDRLGVAEVAFGGGEPLVFKGIFDLIDRLVTETRLAVHLTTNGVLLNDAALVRLKGKVGQIRVSLYEDNHWRTTLARLRAHDLPFGVNLIVTPHNVDALSAVFDELRALECRDVLLLPALGHPDLALDADATRRFASWLAAMDARDLTIKLGVCWGQELAHLPRLFPHTDCGAGREFLEITSDRQVRPCSFHAEAVPFQSADDVIALWASQRPAFQAPAACFGCPRGCEPRRARVQPFGVRVYDAFASNNSGSYTLLGRFQTSERAAEITALLTQLAADMEATGEDSNPLRDLLAAAGIAAPADVGRNDDWPAEYVAADPPEAVQVDQQVWWYAHYTVTMPMLIGHWFFVMGGRVDVELVHAHHPLIAQLDLWHDAPWDKRTSIPIQPVIDALRSGPLSEFDMDTRIRQSEYGNVIEILWAGPKPDQMRSLLRSATALGLRARLTLSEATKKTVNLDDLW